MSPKKPNIDTTSSQIKSQSVDSLKISKSSKPIIAKMPGSELMKKNLNTRQLMIRLSRIPITPDLRSNNLMQDKDKRECNNNLVDKTVKTEDKQEFNIGSLKNCFISLPRIETTTLKNAMKKKNPESEEEKKQDKICPGINDLKILQPSNNYKSAKLEGQLEPCRGNISGIDTTHLNRKTQHKLTEDTGFKTPITPGTVDAANSDTAQQLTKNKTSAHNVMNTEIQPESSMKNNSMQINLTKSLRVLIPRLVLPIPEIPKVNFTIKNEPEANTFNICSSEGTKTNPINLDQLLRNNDQNNEIKISKSADDKKVKIESVDHDIVRNLLSSNVVQSIKSGYLLTNQNKPGSSKVNPFVILSPLVNLGAIPKVKKEEKESISAVAIPENSKSGLSNDASAKPKEEGQEASNTPGSYVPPKNKPLREERSHCMVTRRRLRETRYDKRDYLEEEPCATPMLLKYLEVRSLKPTGTKDSMTDESNQAANPFHASHNNMTIQQGGRNVCKAATAFNSRDETPFRYKAPTITNIDIRDIFFNRPMVKVSINLDCLKPDTSRLLLLLQKKTTGNLPVIRKNVYHFEHIYPQRIYIESDEPYPSLEIYNAIRRLQPAADRTPFLRIRRNRGI